jgi:DUF438 domain-containing protein
MSEALAMHVGELLPDDVRAILGVLPVDLTFVDADNVVRWYSPHRIFDRRPSDIGRDVVMCHSEATRPAVGRLIAELRDGIRDVAEFLERSHGRLVQVRYFALRDEKGLFRGVLEMAQEIRDVWPDAEAPAQAHRSVG